ncbi:MAG: hypothetical protein IJS46_02260, partial [Kiritimatiellae bacterium]|nr:hypothetical protein [Kiritimatiellia bacterium]
MKNTCFKFRSFFLRFGPGFAAGVAAGAALTLWSGSSCRPPEAPGGLGGAGQSPPEYIDIAAPKPERVEPLSWRVALLTGERDARFPVISISANRNMFTADATNGVEGIALLHDGRQIPFKVVDAPDPGTTNNWFDVSPLNPVEPGELEVRISKDFPDPAGMPAPAPSWWTAQYAPVPVTIEHVESKAEAFCGDAKTTLWLNREVSEETLGANLVFKPEVSGISITRVGERCWNDAGGYTHGWDSPRYEICGSFKPGTRYRVGFASRLMETEDGCVALSSTNAVAFTASGADSAIEWLDGGMNLGGENLGAAVAIRADRVPRVEISAQRILPGNLVFALRNWDAWAVDNDDWCESPVSRIAEDFAPDGVATNLVALDDFSPAGGPRLPDGLWFVRVRAMPRADEPQDAAMPAPLSRLVARSDTAITARCLSDEVVVWTTRISTGLPATNCTVALYARNNTVVAEGAVDSTGVAVLSPGKSDYPPVLAVASAPDGQYSFLELKYANYLDEMPERPGDVFAADAAQLDGWIGCDRGIYRHGERVFVEALVRDAAGKAPERRPVVMNVERGDGTGVMHWNLMTDERGRASPPNGFFQIPDSQPSGTWRISLSTPGSDGVELASRKFRVEAFVPPKIKVSIADLPGVFTPDRAPGAPDAPGAIEAGISSRYFHGSPASGLAYEAFAYAAAAPFSPEGWDGSWVVGAPSRTCGNLRGKRVKGSLGSDGSDCAEVPLPHLPNPPAAVLRLRVQTSVFEHGGRAVTAEKCTDWHVYPYYIAAKEPVGAKPGAHVSFPVRLVLPDGSAATNAPAAPKAALSTVRTEWLWEKKTGEDGWAWRRHRIEREIGSGEFAVADAVSAVDFTLAQGVHDYVLRISPAGDAPGEGAFAPLTELEFSGGEAEAPAAANPDRIEIKCDGKSYAPGSVAKVSLRAPFDGIALVTLQQRSLVEHRLVTVSNGTATVEIPVERALAPSFDIAASLVRAAAPGEEWPEHRAFGAATVAVENPAADLAAAMPQPAVSPLPGGG